MLLMPRLLRAVLDLLMEEDTKTQPWVYYGMLLVCLSNMDLGWFGSWRILPILTINIHQLHLSQDPLLAPGLSCLERMAMFTMFTGNMVCQHPPLDWLWQFDAIWVCPRNRQTWWNNMKHVKLWWKRNVLKYQLWECHDKFLGKGLQYLPKLHPRIFSHRTEAHKIIMSSRNIVFKPVFFWLGVFFSASAYICMFFFFSGEISISLPFSTPREQWFHRAWSLHIFCTGLKPMATWSWEHRKTGKPWVTSSQL